MLPEARRFSRRQCLQAGGMLLAGGVLLGVGWIRRAQAMAAPTQALPFNPQEVLRSFERGRLIDDNGRRLRVFKVEARSITLPLGGEVLFKAWTLNGRIPGPTLRAREGERIRVAFRNGDSTSHSLHFHGVHPAEMDGIEPVLRGRSAIYDFDLPRAGIYPYHCHVAPVSRHVGKGLFGLLIVDPPTPRPAADELVLVMGGYD